MLFPNQKGMACPLDFTATHLLRAPVPPKKPHPPPKGINLGTTGLVMRFTSCRSTLLSVDAFKTLFAKWRPCQILTTCFYLIVT